MFTTENENRLLLAWLKEDIASLSTDKTVKYEATFLTPDVIKELVNRGMAQWTDQDEKRWLRMTMYGRRYLTDYLHYDMDID